MKTKLQEERFKVIDLFLKNYKRLPNNFELLNIFSLNSTSATHLLLRRYKENQERCPYCNKII